MPLQGFWKVFRRLPLQDVMEAAEKTEYRKTLSVWDLISIGVGGIIGAGIFVITGVAARDLAGPAIVLSFVMAGFVSTLSALCYAELASALPVSGSAYSFAYISMGELLGWIIGWDLMLEYLVGGAAVAVGWSGYLGVLQSVINELTGSTYVFDPRFVNAPLIFFEYGATIPWLSGNDSTVASEFGSFYLNQVNIGSEASPVWANAIINIPALVIILVLMALLMFGMKESATANNVMVAVKTVVILVVIFAGIKFIDPANYSPFIPPQEGSSYGFQGVVKGAASVFFAYIGFDSVSTVAQEAKNPQRDLPVGIIGSLLICTALYIAVSLVLCGMVNYKDVDVKAPIAAAFTNTGLPWLTLFIDLGALVGLTSVILNLMIGQPRIFQSMAADGLFPRSFGEVSAKRGTPYVATLTTGIVSSVFAALLPVDFLANLTSVGTLFAFSFVSLSCLFLRITHPDLPRVFKIPGIYADCGGFVIPFVNLLSCIYLLANQSFQNAIRVFIWMCLGLVIYAFFGFKNSKLQGRMDRMESDPSYKPVAAEKKWYA